MTVDVCDPNDDTMITGTELIHEDLGTLHSIMTKDGEEHLIGGVAYFSVGVSCKHNSGQEPPSAGSCVKLSLKMIGPPSSFILLFLRTSLRRN